MSDIVRRLRASVIYDAVSGSSCERHICERQMSEAADEIEQLREALAKANEQVGDLINDVAASDPKDRVWVLVPLVEFAEKDRRIAELEDASVKEVLDFGVEQLSRGHDKYCLITEEQINHAWSFRETDPNGCIDAALSCFNIFPCEACGWSGHDGTITTLDIEVGWADCPTCRRNGKSHGWVIVEARMSDECKT
jgi:hypothetical protein